MKAGGEIMQITDYNVDMFSQWKKEATYTREESLSTSLIRVKVPESEAKDQLTLTSQARNLIKRENGKINTNNKVDTKEKPYINLSEEDKQKIQILEAFLSRLTGK